VTRDLLGRPKAAPAHNHQKRAAHLLGRRVQPVHRRAVGLAEAGATPFAMVTLTASQRAVSHHVRRGTLGIGAGWFGSRGAHLGPPYSTSVASHVNRVTTRNCWLYFIVTLVGKLVQKRNSDSTTVVRGTREGKV
jgi:hypothetical protein